MKKLCKRIATLAAALALVLISSVTLMACGSKSTTNDDTTANNQQAGNQQTGQTNNTTSLSPMLSYTERMIKAGYNANIITGDYLTINGLCEADIMYDLRDIFEDTDCPYTAEDIEWVVSATKSIAVEKNTSESTNSVQNNNDYVHDEPMVTYIYKDANFIQCRNENVAKYLKDALDQINAANVQEREQWLANDEQWLTEWQQQLAELQQQLADGSDDEFLPKRIAGLQESIEHKKSEIERDKAYIEEAKELTAERDGTIVFQGNRDSQNPASTAGNQSYTAALNQADKMLQDGYHTTFIMVSDYSYFGLEYLFESEDCPHKITDIEWAVCAYKFTMTTTSYAQNEVSLIKCRNTAVAAYITAATQADIAEEVEYEEEKLARFEQRLAELEEQLAAAGGEDSDLQRQIENQKIDIQDVKESLACAKSAKATCNGVLARYERTYEGIIY